jgi:hypothetical protein
MAIRPEVALDPRQLTADDLLEAAAEESAATAPSAPEV